MPKVCGVDKLVDPKLKPKTQVKTKGIPQPNQRVPELVPQPQPRASLVLHRERQGRAGTKTKIMDINCNLYHSHSLSLHHYLQYPLYQNL